MKLYLHTSALVKLYVDEEGSSVVHSGVDNAELVATSELAYLELDQRSPDDEEKTLSHSPLIEDFWKISKLIGIGT